MTSPASPPAPAPLRWLELSLDERCNLRCLGCRANQGGDRSLPLDRALARMRQARAAGSEALWLGGGEPTLRPELPRLIAAARALGFREVLLQTNGLRLLYPAYTAALVAAGLTTVRLNLKSADADLHDRLTGQPGSHALLDQALAALPSPPLRLEGDLLLTRSTAPGLADAIARYAARGVRVFSLWLLSAHGETDPAVQTEVPRITDLLPHLHAAAQAAREAAVALETLHTPWCTLPPALWPLYRPAASWGLVVVDPSDRPFPLASSPIEGGAYQPACASCSRRPGCPGPRADYVGLHGAGEFHGVDEAPAFGV